MLFKLVRTDCAEPCKIQLPVGTHTIGRGKFLDCDDRRVSRNHGQLVVDGDSVIIKALHQNPCFYQRKGTQKIEVLKQNVSLELSHGDRFGLLPDTLWFEVLCCTSLEDNAAVPTVEIHPRPVLSSIENTQINTEVTNGIGDRTMSGATEIQNDIDEDELPSVDFNETFEDPNRAESYSVIGPRESARDRSPLRDQLLVANAPTASNEATAQTTPVQDTPTKRSHIPEPQGSPKKVKAEPMDVKQEQDSPNKPGPSQMGAPNPGPGAAGAAPAAAPGGRQRCWYGASCYRKNPQHKRDFSHASDPDWGEQSGRMQCPYGGQCRKADPGHWRHHDHPAGTRPPVAARAPEAKRKPAQKRENLDSDESESSGQHSPAQELIVTEKRARKPVARPRYSGSEEDDPYETDGSDDWKPDGAKEDEDSDPSQDYLFTAQAL